MHKNSFLKKKQEEERETQSLTDWLTQLWTAADA